MAVVALQSVALGVLLTLVLPLLFGVSGMVDEQVGSSLGGVRSRGC